MWFNRNVEKIGKKRPFKWVITWNPFLCKFGWYSPLLTGCNCMLTGICKMCPPININLRVFFVFSFKDTLHYFKASFVIVRYSESREVKKLWHECWFRFRHPMGLTIPIVVIKQVLRLRSACHGTDFIDNYINEEYSKCQILSLWKIIEIIGFHSLFSCLNKR